jgi:hypothetical protein
VIPWGGLLANGLWVLGLALLLATWSLAYDEGQRSGRRVGAVLRRRGYAQATTVGLLLFCAGLAATETRWWARLLWLLLGLAFAVEGLFGRAQEQRDRGVE